MKILTIGCGYIGSVLVEHLVEKLSSADMVISDENEEMIKRVADNINKNNVRSLQLDVSDYRKLVSTMKNFNIVVGLAPGRLGYKTIVAAIEAGVDMVDLSYTSEDPMRLHGDALREGLVIIPDCGVAPGLSNVLVGRAVSLLDEVKEVRILVGGLPQRRIPPLDYKVTWCVEDLIEEYVRPAKIVRDGETIEVEALSGLEEVEFPGIGKLEAFFTDGVRTLHHTVKGGVRNMWEKTMRYPGHAEKIKLFRELGFFDEKRLGQGISPRGITVKLLERELSMPEVKDLVAMNIDVIGAKEGVETRCNYHLLDYFDEKKRITAMGRTTAYTASVVVQLLAEGEIKEKGIVPPEKLGMDREMFNKIMMGLEGDGVKVSETVSSTR